jgi:protein-glutamine gamma-glutamyltransferase
LYAYSDNPGIPGLPSANKLTYFLFENRKGYCAYFAGATLFMLRSLGIPSRVVAGYSVTDRSSKNPGWYWFYQDQAHAWVQVYFQDYGWIDFDTTIPDVNTQQASQPDGTPPTDMPQTYFVADGNVVSVDTVKKLMNMTTEKILYHDSEFVSKAKIEILLDVAIANIINDTGEVKLKTLEKGMHITAISHALILKNIFTKEGDNIKSILSKIPKPIPIDEIKIISDEKTKKQNDKTKIKENEAIDWLNVISITLISVFSLAILLLFAPALIWLWFNAKAKREKGTEVYYRYRASLYYLSQLGNSHDDLSPQNFALNVDKTFNTDFVKFCNIYQKLKYSSVSLNDTEKETLDGFYPIFIKAVKSKISFNQRMKSFFNIYLTINFFSKPKIN